MTYIKLIEKGWAIIGAAGAIVEQRGVIESVAHPGTGQYEVSLSEALSEIELSALVMVRGSVVCASAIDPQSDTLWVVRLTRLSTAAPFDSDFELHLRQVSGPVA